jgi:hypothetical protein
MTDDEIIEAALGNKPANDTGEPYKYEEEFWLQFPFYSKDFASEVVQRFGDHLERWLTTNISSAVWTAYRAYHGLSANPYATNADPVVSITVAGEDGEFMSMDMNHYRGLVKHQIALVTANRPAWDPQARTTDARASQQVSLTRGLLDYTMDELRLGLDLVDQYEIAKVAASGWIALGWKETGDGKGTVVASTLAPWEVCHERVRDYKTCQWWIYRTYESRWDWVARFAAVDPEKARKIAGLKNEPHVASAFMYDDPEGGGDKADRFEALHVFAKPSEACPKGRYAIIADGELVLLDGPNPYGDDVPISDITPARFVGTSVPFGDSWSLLAPGDAYNAMLSMAMTRVEAHGVPTLGVPAGSEFTRDDFSGNKMLEMGPAGMGEPKVLDMLSIPNELPNMMNLVKAGMEELSGINSVTRGNPQENVSSGSYAALLQSMAIQFNSADEKAWIANLERVGSLVVRIYQRMATEKQLISICGSDETWTAREFRSEDLDQIQRVAIKPANALSKTIAGRLALGETMLEKQMIQTPQEFLQVVATGNVEPLYSGSAKELSLIKSENEMLMRGEAPKVSIWDNDQLHIREHKCLLDTQLRNTPLAKGVMTHLQEHMMSWGQQTLMAPDTLAAKGQAPLPAAQAAAQQAAQLEGGGMQQPQEGPRQQVQPETEEPPKGKPGPQGAPPGREPGPMPSEPEPAKTPGGEAVVP